MREPMHSDSLLTDVADLLPPATGTHPLPRRAARRAQLLRAIDQPDPRPRWRVPVPALAAGALAATVAVATLGVVVLDRDTTPAPRPAVSSMPALLQRIDAATATPRNVDLAPGQVVYQQLLPLAEGAERIDTWTTADGTTRLVRQGPVPKPMETYVSADGSAIERAIYYPSYRTVRALGSVTPEALLRELARTTAGTTADAHVSAFTSIQAMLAVGLVPTEVRAMLFHAMASIPGVTFDRTSPGPYRGVPRLVLGRQWTAVDLATGGMFADQDHRYLLAAPAPALGRDPVRGEGLHPTFGPLRDAGSVPSGTVKLAVPDVYDALAPATTVTFRDRVGEARGPRWRLHYAIGGDAVSADVNGDGHTDLVTVIEVHGVGNEGPPESSYAVVVYVRDSSGLVPFGVVRVVPALSEEPSVSVANGVITVAGATSYRWDGVWFAPAS